AVLTRLADPAQWQAHALVQVPPAQLAIIAQANDTDAETSDAVLHELFDAQVAERPTHVALRASGLTLTYEQLQGTADSPAWEVCDAGATQGSLIAVVMDKGWEQVAAVLAV